MTPANSPEIRPVSGRRPLSAVLIARNEEHRIGECLASLAFADEIVVVESGSVDNTVGEALKYTRAVHHVPWKGFGPQKQAAVELASHDLILSIDCDERVPPELAAEIQALLSGESALPGYRLPRKTFIGDKAILHSGWSPDRIVRLFDRRHARFSEDPVHERVIVDGSCGDLTHPLLHYSFAGVSDLFRKIEFYSALSAQRMFENGRRFRLSDLTFRPAFAFVKTFLLKAGFLDGVEGLQIAVSGAVHVFVKYAKLRELEKTAQRVSR